MHSLTPFSGHFLSGDTHPVCNLCGSIDCNDILAALCRRSSVVLEIILELCKCGAVPLFVQLVVLVKSSSTSWSFASDGIHFLHGNDFHLLCTVLWFDGCNV